MLGVRVKQTGTPATLGADKAYDLASHGAALRKNKLTPLEVQRKA